MANKYFNLTKEQIPVVDDYQKRAVQGSKVILNHFRNVVGKVNTKDQATKLQDASSHVEQNIEKLYSDYVGNVIKCNTLGEQLEKRKETITGLESQVTGLETNLNDISNKLEETKKSLETTQAGRTDLEAKYSKLQEEHHTVEEKLSETQTTLDAARKDFEVNQSEIALLTKTSKEYAKAIKANRAKIERLESRRDNLAEALDTERAKTNNLESKLTKQVKASEKTLANTKEQYEKNAQSLYADLRTANYERDSALEQVKNYEASLEGVLVNFFGVPLKELRTVPKGMNRSEVLLQRLSEETNKKNKEAKELSELFEEGNAQLDQLLK